MRCSATLAILLSFLASSGWSQTPFFPFQETFDGAIDDDEPVTWLAGGFPVTFTQANGDLILSDPFELFPGFSLGKMVVSKESGPVMDGDTSAQTVFRLSASHAFGAIYTRSQAGLPGRVGVPEDGDGGGYFGNIDGNGLITVGSFLVEELQTLQTTLDPTTSDVVLQLDTMGNSVTASAWKADEPKPEFPPSITFTDDVTRPPGVFGLLVGGKGDAATDVSATFRSFQIVPEPSTVSLLVLGLLGLLGFCRRRHRA